MTWAELVSVVKQAAVIIADVDQAVYLDDVTEEAFGLKLFTSGEDGLYCLVSKKNNEEISVSGSSVFVISNSGEMQLSFYKSWIVANAVGLVSAEPTRRPDMPLLRINAPAWFKDEKFIEWLNHPRTATWHIPGEAPNEYSDVWFTFCQGDGSDSPPGEGDPRPGIPQRIWDHITYMIDDADIGDEVLVWVSNLEVS